MTTTARGQIPRLICASCISSALLISAGATTGIAAAQSPIPVQQIPRDDSGGGDQGSDSGSSGTFDNGGSDTDTDTGDQGSNGSDTGDQPSDTGDQSAPPDTGSDAGDHPSMPSDNGGADTGDQGSNGSDTGDQPSDTGDQSAPPDTGSDAGDHPSMPSDNGGADTGDQGSNGSDTGDQPSDTGDQSTPPDTGSDAGDHPSMPSDNGGTDTGDQGSNGSDTGDQPSDTGDQSTPSDNGGTNTGDQSGNGSDTGNQPGFGGAIASSGPAAAAPHNVNVANPTISPCELEHDPSHLCINPQTGLPSLQHPTLKQCAAVPLRGCPKAPMPVKPVQTPLKPNAQKKVIGGLLCRVSAGGTRCPKAPKRTNGGLVRSIQNVLPKQNQVTQPQQNTQCQNGSCPTEAVKKLMDDASKAVREKLHGKEKETKRDPNGIYLFSQSAQSQGRSSSASDSGREYSG